MKRLDILQTVLATLSIIGWSVAIYALVIFGQARPDPAVGYFRSKGVEVRLEWDPHLTIQLEYWIWVCAIVSFINLIVNFYAQTTTKIGFWVNIPLLLVVSLSAGLYIRYVI
ncbi:hypothetical protein ACFOD0_14285 [Shewanella intestini]|uniref:Uncharacterized protein n=1 Tax=Shewanella intestini TaxID=2017544 RepID=A0ABS5I6Q2_9GAMM|nr:MULTISPECIES: hypothetical protein [Shewanella]MBR9729005.1 hypothetical protein [Shewanella intestini]MRG36929.1 hypothetical protein [Shewanella sp. XMDDZSB0408]